MDFRHYLKLVALLLFTSVACLGQRSLQLESVSDLNRGLVGRWMFDVGSGTSAPDSSGQNNTGTLSGSALPVWTNGVFGGGLWFTNSAVTNLGNGFGAVAISGSDAATISVWFKQEAASIGSDRTFFINTITNNLAKVFVGMTTGNALWVGARAFHTDSFQSVTSVSAYTDTNLWHHVSGVINIAGDAIAMYVDGVAVSVSGTPAWSNTAFSSSVGTNHVIGNNAPFSQPFRGRIDDVRIWNRALSATEVLNLWAAGAGR